MDTHNPLAATVLVAASYTFHEYLRTKEPSLAEATKYRLMHALAALCFDPCDVRASPITNTVHIKCDGIWTALSYNVACVFIRYSPTRGFTIQAPKT